MSAPSAPHTTTADERQEQGPTPGHVGMEDELVAVAASASASVGLHPG